MNDSFCSAVGKNQKHRWLLSHSTWIFLGIFVVYLSLSFFLGKILPVKEALLKIRQVGFWAPFLFTAVYLARGFTYFPSLVFLILSGLIFSTPVGFSTYLSAVVLSACLSYMVGRWLYTKPFLEGLKIKISGLAIRERIQRQGAMGVLALHLVGFLDAANYTAGFLKVPFRKFIVSVLVANLLTTTAYYTLVLFIYPGLGKYFVF